MSYRFDAAADILTLPPTLPGTATFTWMAWIRWEADDENYNCLFDWGLAEAGAFAAVVIDGGNQFPVSFGNNALIFNTGGTYGGGSLITPGVWYHIAYVKNGSSHTIYLDGVSDITATEDTALPSAGTVNFGNNPFSEVFNGRMGPIKMWSVALSGAEVLAEMATADPVRTADLYAWWDAETLDDYTDDSGNGHTLVEGGSVTIEAGPPLSATEGVGTSSGSSTVNGVSSGTGIINVASGGNLQTALDAAVDGDEIRLEAGATFTGNFTIPSRSPQVGTVVVTTAGTLPDRRIDIADAAALATIHSSTNDYTIDVGTAANSGWVFRGVQITGGTQTLVGVRGASSITFDRCLMVGGSSGTTRGIAGNGTSIVVDRCYISNIWKDGQDCQAFAAWDGAGPYTLTNNYLEASGENIMFGGADASSDADMPADILFEDNHLFKPLSWQTDTPHHLVKNIFELKVGARVTVRRNRLENCWTDGQTGFGIVLSPRNQDGTAPWSRIEDVLFEDNIIIAERGISMIGYDDVLPSGRMQRITVRNCLFQTDQIFTQFSGELLDVTFDHVTIANAADRIAMMYMGDIWPDSESLGANRPATYAVSNLTWTNCVMSHRSYGVYAEGDGQGTSALNFQVLDGASGYVWTNNAVAAAFLGGDPGYPVAYPSGTLTPDQATHDAQFVDTVTYPLIPGSLYEGVGTGGSNLGWTEEAEAGGVVSAVGTASGTATTAGIAVASAIVSAVGAANGLATVDGVGVPYNPSAAAAGNLLTVVDAGAGETVASPFNTSSILTLTAPASVGLAPVGDVTLNPGGKDVLPGFNYDINLGMLSKKYLTLHAAELWVETLVAQNTIATIGGRILVLPTNVLAVDLAAASTTMVVKYNNFTVGDRLYMESATSTSGLVNQVEFFAVTAGPTGSGPYSYTVTRNLDATTANDWVAGDAVANTGTTGNGFIDLYSVRGVRASTELGPTIVGNVRLSPTFNDWAPRWAIGNLNGLYNIGSTTHGAAFGDPAATNIVIDATNGIRIRYGVANKLVADISGNLTLTGDLTIGTAGTFRSAGATALDTGVGLFMAGGTTPTLRVGNPAGNRIRWNGTTLTVVSETVTMDAAGITIAVPPTGLTALYGYKFASVLSGTNVVGMFAYEPTSVTRALTLFNSNNVDARAIQTYIQASNGTSQSVVTVAVDAGNNTLITLSADLVDIPGSSNLTVGASVLLGSGGVYTWVADANTYFSNDTTDGIRATCGAGAITVWRTGGFAPGGNSSMYLGTDSLRWTTVFSTNADDISSDRRLKSEIEACDLGTAFLLGLRPVSFVRQDSGCVGRSYGLIAQEVDAVLEGRAVSFVTKQGFYGLRYDELIAPVITGFQELERRVQALERRV